MDKVRDINVDGVRTFLFRQNNNLGITEFTEENDVHFKKFAKQELLHTILIFVAAAVLIVGNYYSINYLGPILSLGTDVALSGKELLGMTVSIFVFAISIASLVIIINDISYTRAKDVFVISKIRSFFSLLSKTGRDKLYAEFNKDEYLLFHVKDRYGMDSLNLLNKNFDEFSDDELSQFVKNIKEQMKNRSRINKIKKIVLKNEADKFILKDLKNQKQELEQRDEELGDSIASFLSDVKELEKDKARKKANEEAMGVLAG